MSAGEITQEDIDEFVAVSFARRLAFSRTAAASLFASRSHPTAPSRLSRIPGHTRQTDPPSHAFVSV